MEAARFGVNATIRVPSTPENVRSGNFDPNAPPVARIESGDSVILETVYAAGAESLLEAGVERSEILADEVRQHERPHEGPGPHAVTGPVYVEGARPDDVLEVRVLDIELRTSYGINHFLSGRGVLPEAFPEGNRRVIRIDRDRRTAQFSETIEIPIEPFFGIMAVAPARDAGRTSTLPPSHFGGNMDVKLLGAGSTVYFPVNTEGGLFFAGDGHAVQGNGEVDLTALETSLTGEFELRLHEDVPHVEYPVAETDDEYVVIGIAESLDSALERAVHEAVSFLVRQQDLSAREAYHLSSLAVDFDVSQAVNGVVGIHGRIPKSIFERPEPIDPRRFREPFGFDAGRSRADA